MRRFLFRAGSAGAVLGALALLACFFVPGWLESSKLTVAVVEAKFKTPEERDELKAQAELFGESAYSALYSQKSESVEAYLPAKSSLQHGFLGLIGTIMAFDRPAASREDLLVDAPEQRNLIDVQQAYPVQTRSVNFFLWWFKAGFGVGVIVCAIVSLLARPRAKATSGRAAGNPG